MSTIPYGIKLITFDIWKTLLVGNKSFSWPRLQLIFSQLGIDHRALDRENVLGVYRRISEAFDLASEQTGYDYGLPVRLATLLDELELLPQSALHYLDMRQLGIDLGQLRSQPEHAPQLIEPDLADTLQVLRKQNYRLALLSNTGMDNWLTMGIVLHRLELWDLFDLQVFSDQSGLAKPNPRLFSSMLRKLDIKPHQALHIGDNLAADVSGATQAGMHAYHFDPSLSEADERPTIGSIRSLIGQ